MIELKIMIYNMHHGIGMDGRPNLERIAKLVKEIRPDIVGFNEVDRFFHKRSGFEDQFTWFCSELGLNCAFGAAITRKKGTTVREYGNALFSRFPIVSHINHGLRARRLTISEPRAVLEAEIDLGYKHFLKIFLTHLSFIPVLRRIQTELVVQRLEAEDGPSILMGDFNMIPGSSSWNAISGVCNDATNTVHGRAINTFPSIHPVTQKDYIFASQAINIQNVERIETDRLASDHLPLLATVSLTTD
jgi:endonuclease/exonuclease/phosphatase family metal-dependent hydrolase